MTEFYFNNIHLFDIELSNRCNAACPMCARNIHGYSINPRLQLDELTLDDIKNIDERYLYSVQTINLSGNYGDPIICTEVIDIIKYFLKNTSARIIVNTNGGLRKPEFWHMLGLLDPERLEIRFAIDGLEDTNHIYRINVKWDKVIENAKAFIKAGGLADWHFLVFKHNQHQVEEAREFAKKLGFKIFNSIVSNRWREETFPVLDKHGKIMYNLTPTTINKDDYEKFNHRKEGTLRLTNKIKSKGHSYLNKSYEKQSWKNFVNEEEKQPSLSCYASADNRIYIDANGYVFPCNNTGYIHGWANRYDYFADQIIEKLNQYTHTNIKNDNLSTILNGNWIKYIHETWQATTIKEGRLLMCSYTCGNQSAHKIIKEHRL